MAWSCWNYLTFSNSGRRESGRHGSGMQSENALYSREEESKWEKSLNADVNHVSLSVLFTIFSYVGCS